jgi:uncharacterized repeat protein (TIGR01451 family)
MRAQGEPSTNVAEAGKASQVRSPTAEFRWSLIATLFVAGVALCVAAFVVDDGTAGLGPSALLQFGSTIGLVGVLYVLQTFLVREVSAAVAPVGVNTYVRPAGGTSDDWKTVLRARPGDELEHMIRFENNSRRTLYNVVAGDNLPAFHAYAEGSTWLRNGAHPNGLHLTSDNLTRGGIDIGHYEPGAVGYVRFTVRLDPAAVYPRPGTHDTRNIGIVRSLDLPDHYSVSTVLIDVG